jgi:quercetin dioxygenase-like cupin family protein
MRHIIFYRTVATSPESAPLPLPLLGALDAGGDEHPYPGVVRRTAHTEHATLVSYAFAPGAAFPRHRHDQEQITVFCEGDVLLDVGDEQHALAAGATYVVAPGVEHGLTAGPRGARFFAIVAPRRAAAEDYTIVPDPKDPA